ncbi:flagellar basal-body rod protein FlgF [bacterium]|nr:MAG: flagellar basal-body rod protein FlgF [bacterium]
MSLMRSLAAGISGMKGFQTKMDVIGNNIANVNTAGFKASQVNFAELVSQSLTKPDARFGSAPSLYNQVGLGSRVSSISRDFTQGAITSTNVKTDLAIQGNGFFMVNDGTQNYITRAGNFKFNADGNLVTDAGLYVRGFNANADGTVINGGSAEDIRVNFGDIYAPQKTSLVNLAGNLNSNTSVSQVLASSNAFTDGSNALAVGTQDLATMNQTNVALVDGDTIDITGTDNAGNAIAASFTYGAANDGTTLDDLISVINTAFAGEATATLQDGKIVVKSDKLGDSSLSIGLAMGAGATGDINFSTLNVSVEGATNSTLISNTVYDTQGEAHTLLTTFTQTDFNKWTIEASFLNGESVSAVNGVNGTTTMDIEFDDEGRLITPSNGSFSVEFDPGNGAESMNFDVEISDPVVGAITQFDGAASANFVKQDGYAQGDLTDFYIDATGLIVGTYSNGRSKNLAQMGVATVANQNALVHTGNGLFSVNTQAGDLIIGSAKNLPDTTISSGFLESSNVDLAQEFTEMIVAQRAYQSAARVITTSDQLLNEITQLKR